MRKEEFLQQLQKACRNTGLNFEIISKELADFIKLDEIIAYHVAQGPFPDFPDALLDIFMLDEKRLYDYEWRSEGSLYHVLPLNKISEISEEFSGKEKNSFSVSFLSTGLTGGLVLQDKLEHKEHLRNFFNIVKDKTFKS